MDALVAAGVHVDVVIAGGLLTSTLLLKIFPDLETVMFLVPGHTMTRPWQVLTCGFFEDAFVNLLVGICALLSVGKLLRQVWGEHELLRFVLLTNCLQGILTYICMIILYILFREEHFLFARLGGVTGLLASLSVALMQQRHRLDSESFLPLSTAPTDRGGAPLSSSSALPRGALAAAAEHAPSLCVVWAALVLCATHSGPPDELLFAFNGAYCSWLYLRFFQAQNGAPPGDASAGFALAMLVPPPLRPPVRLIADATYAFLSSCGLCMPAPSSADALGLAEGLYLGGPSTGMSGLGGGGAGFNGGSSSSGTPAGIEMQTTPRSVTTTDPEVAERRRERARALIEARLASKSAQAAVVASTPADGGAAAVMSAATPATPVTPACSGEPAASGELS